MTPERLRQLIAIYGATPDRWPAGERAAALALLPLDAPAKALVAREERLDSMLDRYRVPIPHAGLIGSILAHAPAGGMSRLQAWWTGIGFAAAAIAGMVAGAGAMPHLIDRPEGPAEEAMTVFAPVDLDAGLDREDIDRGGTAS